MKRNNTPPKNTNAEQSTMNASYPPVSFNVIESMCDTVTNKIAKNRPRPTFVPSGGDYQLRQRVKLLDRFMPDPAAAAKAKAEIPVIQYNIVRLSNAIHVLLNENPGGIPDGRQESGPPRAHSLRVRSSRWHRPGGRRV